MVNESLKDLKLKRRSIKSSCTRAKNYINSLNIENVSLIELQQRRSKFLENWDKFSEIQTAIESLEEEEQDSDNQEQEREDFEATYFELATKFETLILQKLPAVNQQVQGLEVNIDNQQVQQGERNHIRLPKIDLPTFSGVYEDWYPFFDTFSSLIHSNVQLQDIQKFHYLKSALKDQAAQVIESLEISAANYVEAWNMLKNRYDNKRIIIQKHVKSIFELPSLPKESHTGLRQLLDGILKHLRALRALERPTDYWDDLIMHILATKLDPITNKEWETSLKDTTVPTLQNMTDFLSQRCQAFEAIIRKPAATNNPSSSGKVFQKGTTSHFASSSVCQICKGNHWIYYCERFLALPIEGRIKEARSHNLCLNCLRSTKHRTNTCTSSGCKRCKKRHNTLLHLEQLVKNKSELESGKENVALVPNEAQVSSASHMAQKSNPCQILLSTAILEVYDSKGQLQQCRALLDNGSQSNFITQAFVSRLGLEQFPANIPVSGLNNALTQIHSTVDIRIKSRFNNFSCNMECLVSKNLTQNLPSISFKGSDISIPKNITMADPNFYVSSEIDLLIGVEVFWGLMCEGQIRLAKNQPYFQKTQLGWIVAGKVPASTLALTGAVCNHSADETLSKALKRFWEIEHVSERTKMNPEGKACEEHFYNTYKRKPDGRFVVSLPIRVSNMKKLGSSKETALNRFYALERKLNRNPELKSEYLEFIQEYEKLNHMKQVLEKDQSEDIWPNFYLPHHAVIKKESLTTRLRVVFDASCKSSTGISLNDSLMIGPALQQDLFSIITRFRTFQYAFTSDITKMYRQVLVDAQQTPLQRILWRKDGDENIQTYELLTVTYGTGPASYLAVKALQQTAIEHAEEYPTASKIVLRDFYMDDLLTGANTIAEARSIRDDVISLLKKGGFSLRKWASNSAELLQDLQASNKISEQALLTLEKQETMGILGINWNPRMDKLQYAVKADPSSDPITKRIILSKVSQIFDPLGLLGPAIVSAKIILQQLWLLKLSWDDPLPEEMQSKWNNYFLDLRKLNQLQIPRKILRCQNPCSVQIHGFCDASQQAYGAAIYLRVTDSKSDHTTSLICSKSKVAPIKNVSLPRLELCGALLLSQLTSKILKIIDLKIDETHFWTDSQIVLCWIKATRKRWNIFVANRVGEILELTAPESWHHVSTLENPADLITRGVNASELLQQSSWWTGPSWLREDYSKWPLSEFEIDETTLFEERKSVIVGVNLSSETEDYLFGRFSSYSKMLRISAYCLRFFHNCKNKIQQRRFGSLTPQELTMSMKRLIKSIQGSYFKTEITLLSNNKCISKNSNLLSLNPFLDSDAILRVGGRLRNSRCSYSVKHPILLIAKHPYTRMLIEYEHKRHMHAGPQGTLAANPSPELRTQISRPFATTGVDYGGPIYLREGTRGRSRTIKAYIAVFVCFSTKAVHVELVSDLTSEAFLNALKRFMARRGKPSKIFSDNGTNFMGANKELQKLRKMFNEERSQKQIINTMCNEGVVWSFIPPHSPHFGGLWEASIKSVKYHLKRTCGDARLSFEEMYTLLTQIESILNSRPLIPLSNDPNDFSYLTPSHFLIGDLLKSTAEPDLADIKVNRLSKWQRVEQLRQHFWKRWKNEYLHEQQQRSKWRSNEGIQPQVGQLVIVKEDQCPPLQWPVGRILQVHPGSDGVVRTATIRTAKGQFKRPMVKLCILPIETDIKKSN